MNLQLTSFGGTSEIEMHEIPSISQNVKNKIKSELILV